MNLSGKTILLVISALMLLNVFLLSTLLICESANGAAIEKLVLEESSQRRQADQLRQEVESLRAEVKALASRVQARIQQVGPSLKVQPQQD